MGILGCGALVTWFLFNDRGISCENIWLTLIGYELHNIAIQVFIELTFYQAGSATSKNPVSKEKERELLDKDPNELTCDEVREMIELLYKLIEWRLSDLNGWDSRPNGFDSHEDWLELVVMPRLRYLEDHVDIYCEGE
jgi:hypothetical protein